MRISKNEIYCKLSIINMKNRYTVLLHMNCVFVLIIKNSISNII